MDVVDNYRFKLGSSEFVPIMVGGMGVNISTAELALEACRLGGIGHISDAMNPFVSETYGFLENKYILCGHDITPSTGQPYWSMTLILRLGVTQPKIRKTNKIYIDFFI